MRSTARYPQNDKSAEPPLQKLRVDLRDVREHGVVSVVCNMNSRYPQAKLVIESCRNATVSFTISRGTETLVTTNPWPHSTSTEALAGSCSNRERTSGPARS